jgi:hypothetical protein
MATETTFNSEELSAPRFERFRFQKEELQNTKRILFVSKRVWKDSVHFTKGFGYYRCLGVDNIECPACAKGDNFAKDRWATHVLLYSTDSNGNVSTPFSYKVQAFVYGRGTAKAIQKLQQSLGDKMHKVDVFVTCTSAEFQNLTFMPVFDEAGSKFSQLPEDLKTQCRTDVVAKIAEIDVTKVLAPVVTSEVIRNVAEGRFVHRGMKNATPTVAPPAAAPPAQTSFVPQPTAPVAPPAPTPTAAAPVPATVVTEPPKDAAQKQTKAMLDQLAELDI